MSFFKTELDAARRWRKNARTASHDDLERQVITLARWLEDALSMHERMRFDEARKTTSSLMRAVQLPPKDDKR